MVERRRVKREYGRREDIFKNLKAKGISLLFK
jgi:hypothetical protein